MKRLLLLLTTALCLPSCGGEESRLKDVFSYSEGGRSYFIQDASTSEEITILKCPDLTIAKSKEEAERLCTSEASTPRVFDKVAVAKAFTHTFFEADSDFRKYMAKQSEAMVIADFLETIHKGARSAKDKDSHELSDLDQKIATLKDEISNLESSTSVLEAWAKEAGGETYLSKAQQQRLKELRSLKTAAQAKLNPQIVKSESLRTKLSADLYFRGELIAAIETFMGEAEDANKFVVVKPGQGKIWSYLVDFIYNTFDVVEYRAFAVGIYEASSGHCNGNHPTYPATVTLKWKGKVFLLLTSYEPVHWNIVTESTDLVVSRVFVGGYHKSVVSGVKEDRVSQVKWGYFYNEDASNSESTLNHFKSEIGKDSVDGVIAAYNKNSFSFNTNQN